MLGATTLASVLLVGGAPRWAQAAVAALVVIALAINLGSRRALDGRGPLVLALAAGATWTLLQLVPLPEAVRLVLTPELEALRMDGLELAGVSSWSSLSMDPTSTLRALTFFATLVGVAIAALRIAASPGGRYALSAYVAISAGLAALIAGVHELVGARELYGLYGPSQIGPLLGPLVNPNHLGCLTALGGATSLGLLLHAKQPTWRRAAWTANLFICVIATLATLSRGATLALAVGVVVVVVTVVLQKLRGVAPDEDEPKGARRERFMATTVPIAIMIVCGLVLAVYLAAGSVMHQLEATTLGEIEAPRTKYVAWVSALELVRESPLVGVGRGAFESTFTRVHAASAYATFSHPENQLIQAVVEWGLAGTAIIGGLATWGLLVALRRWRDGALAAGSLGALAAVGFQSNFDFGLELLGLAVPVVLLLATLTYGGLKGRTSQQLPRLRLARAGMLGGVALGGMVLLLPATRTIAETHAQLRPPVTRDALRAAIAAHPMDYFAFSLLAQDLLRESDPSARRVLNHALRLHPTYPALHWMIARIMLGEKRSSQAAAAYATAIRYSTSPRPLLEEVVQRLDEVTAASAIPLEVSPNTVMPLLGRQSPVARRWLERVIVAHPSAAVAEALLTVGLVQKAHGAVELAARSRCTFSPTEACRAELARLLAYIGNSPAVVAEVSDVKQWKGGREDRQKAWLLLCDAHAATGSMDAARTCLRELENSGLMRPGAAEIILRRDKWRPAMTTTSPGATP